MPVTLDDIAAATGFDKSTISVTLRNLPRANRFSPETRHKIAAAALELGYRPNFFARQLSDKKPRLLMLCLNFLRDPFAMMVAEGFEARATECGYRVLITALQDHEDPFHLHREILGLQGVPGMAVVGGASSKLSETSLQQLADDGVKIVLVNRRVNDQRISRISADDDRGAREMAQYIFGQDVKRAWILAGMESPAVEARVDAMLAAARSTGVLEPLLLKAKGINWADSAASVVTGELQRVAAPQAILGVSDVLAVGAARACHDAGLVIGKDIALTGFDDGLYAQCFWPPLTTVRLPMNHMGRAAANSLIQMLEHPDEPAPQLMLPTQLMVRESGRYREK